MPEGDSAVGAWYVNHLEVDQTTAGCTYFDGSVDRLRRAKASYDPRDVLKLLHKL